MDIRRTWALFCRTRLHIPRHFLPCRVIAGGFGIYCLFVAFTGLCICRCIISRESFSMHQVHETMEIMLVEPNEPALILIPKQLFQKFGFTVENVVAKAKGGIGEIEID